MLKQAFYLKLKKNILILFSDKGSNSSEITLVEENNIISDEVEIANIMNHYFINVTKTLNLKKQIGVGRSGVNEILPESVNFQLIIISFIIFSLIIK